MRQLSPSTTKRLRRVAPRLERLLGKMTNLDPRIFGPGHEKNDPRLWGGRVRQLNASRAGEGNLAIKWVHPPKYGSPKTAAQVIRGVNGAVRTYREHFKHEMQKEGFVLLQIPAVAIAHNLIAMPRLDAPTVEQLYFKMSPAAKEYLRRRGIEYNSGGDMRAFPPLIKKAIKIGDHLRQNMGIKCDENDIFFLGVNAKGKLMFMLTADI